MSYGTYALYCTSCRSLKQPDILKPKYNWKPAVNSSESLQALKKALDPELGKQLSDMEAEKNLEDNIVNLVNIPGGMWDDEKQTYRKKSGVYCIGTGLKITTDGWIVTANHNLRRYLNFWRMGNGTNTINENEDLLSNRKNNLAIYTQDSTLHDIETSFLYGNQSLDVAVIRAAILEPPSPIPFRIVREDLKVEDKVRILAMEFLELFHQYGEVIDVYRELDIKGKEKKEGVLKIYKAFSTNAYGAEGFSGGVFENLEKEFAGLCSFKTGEWAKGIGYIGGLQASNVIEVVREAAKQLEKGQNKGKPIVIIVP